MVATWFLVRGDVGPHGLDCVTVVVLEEVGGLLLGQLELVDLGNVACQPCTCSRRKSVLENN